MKFPFSLRPTKVIPPDVHMGADFSVVAKYPVTYAWGTNTSGQLGNNAVTAQSTPIVIGGAKKTFCHVNGANATTYGLTIGGRVWSWGVATNGAGGTNSVTNRSTPVSVCGAVKTFCEITGGGTVTGVSGGALTSGGRAWTWGYNATGQLGDFSITNRSTPVAVLGATKTFCEISQGDTHTMAIDFRGRVWGWGNNANGRLGDNTNVSKRTPVSISGANKTFCQISAGSNFTCGTDKNGRAWCWGVNSSGQLGDNTVTERRTPVAVAGALKTFCYISAGATYTLAIDYKGIAWGWGSNTSGELGILTSGAGTSRSTPVRVSNRVNRTFCTIQAGVSTSIAGDNYGNVWTWGSVSDRLGVIANQYTPVSVLGARKTFCKVGNFRYDTQWGGNAIDLRGRVWSWGDNDTGQLGNNSVVDSQTPVSILGANKTFCKIATGINYTIGLTLIGRAFGWGGNTNAYLGVNSTTAYSSPKAVSGVAKTFCEIATYQQSLAIDQRGKVWAWGRNFEGQLGDNSITNKSTPISVLGAAKTFCKVAAGYFNSYSIDLRGKIWAWGQGSSGALGDNTTTGKSTPVSIGGANKTFCLISAGSSYGCGIDKNGLVWCWGGNTFGQLGDNTITSKNTPVSIKGANKTFCDIWCESASSFGIDNRGRVWTWGRNSLYGLLATGSKQNFSTPVPIFGNLKTFCEIYTGVRGAAAIDNRGLIWSWGEQVLGAGQLGNNPITSTPQRVWRLGGTYLMNT